MSFCSFEKKEHLKSLLESPRCALHKTSKLKKINEIKCEIVQLGVKRSEIKIEEGKNLYTDGISIDLHTIMSFKTLWRIPSYRVLITW